MSLDFKLRYDRLRENDPTKPDDTQETPTQSAFHEAPSDARNLCLMWPDGKQHFVNYAYLVGGELSIGGETNVITLDFSAYTVTIKGYRLNYLFNALLDHLPRFVVAIEKRYLESIAEDQSVITEIVVVKN